MTVEALEKRALLAIDAAFNPVDGVLTIDYNQPDLDGVIATSGQSAVIEIDEVGDPQQTVRVNLYRTSNPNADVYVGVTEIIVNVPNFDDEGVNNNSLAIKGLESVNDRIIMTGAGRTAAGRWSDELESPDQQQVLFEITGIDNLTLTAGGSINVSGSFTNDTNDASITVIGTSLEAQEGVENPGQHTGTIVIGEPLPEDLPADFPSPRLVSNYINVIGGAIEINADIEAAGEVSLEVSDLTAEPRNLVLPFDITVTSNPRTGAAGRLDLFSARSVLQQTTSTIVASITNVVADNTVVPFAASVIDLSSLANDFDIITLQSGTGIADATGKIAVHDCDDLVIGNAGLITNTGLMTVLAQGKLTIDTPIKAEEFKAHSDYGIYTTSRAALTIGNGGIDLTARRVFENATGDITLEGRIEIGDDDLPPVIINNSIQATGIVTVKGGIYAPQAGVTTIDGYEGVLIASPVQFGNTFLNATSTDFVVTDADLILISSNGFIDILDFSGNAAIPQAVQVTNMLSIDGYGDIFIDGQVFVGTWYGDPLDLTETDALPNINIRGQSEIAIGLTGALRTSSYETNPYLTGNPLVGRIAIHDAALFANDGVIDADGQVIVDIEGDAYLYGTLDARTDIDIATSLGIVDIQGRVRSRGSQVPEGGEITPTADVTIAAPSGGISTSSLGTISAGTVVPNNNEGPIHG